MEIGDVQRKDIMDHPENYTLLTTLDEGLFSKCFWKQFDDTFICLNSGEHILDLFKNDFLCPV